MSVNRYVPGSFYRASDFSGKKVRNSDTQKMWNGYWVDGDKEFELRNEQDLVRGVRDEQAAPEPRPRPPPIYYGPLITKLIANVNAGATTASVESAAGWLVGQTVAVMLDTGQSAPVVLTAVGSSTISFVGSPLPWSATAGNIVTNDSAVSGPNVSLFPPNV